MISSKLRMKWEIQLINCHLADIRDARTQLDDEEKQLLIKRTRLEMMLHDELDS